MYNRSVPPEGTTKRDWSIFASSAFFVLGFSVVFSLLGVLLQTVLADVSTGVQLWLARLGGGIIILFGLFLLNLFTPTFLLSTHQIAVGIRFRSHYLTSFVFGAAFAVGWTPCVSAALGAILALAATNAGGAFFLLLAYTVGIGVPFLLVGLFTDRAQAIIQKAGRWLETIQHVFGVILIAIGVLVFTGELSRIANIQFLTNILTSLNIGVSAGGGISSLTLFNLAIAFLAGVGSFLSPCILPLIPGFLSYLAGVSVKKQTP